MLRSQRLLPATRVSEQCSWSIWENVNVTRNLGVCTHAHTSTKRDHQSLLREIELRGSLPVITMKSFPEASWVCKGQLLSVLAGNPQPATLTQSEKAAEGKTDPMVVSGWQSCEPEVANQPLGCLPSFPPFLLLWNRVCMVSSKEDPQRNTPHQCRCMSYVHFSAPSSLGQDHIAIQEGLQSACGQCPT